MENRIEGMPGMDMRTLEHDMRAPIANVIALAQMSMRALTGGGAQETILPYLSKILVAAQELKQLTGELAGGEAAREERFTALDITKTLGATIGAQAAQKNQLLRIDVSGLGSQTLIADRTALMRVLTNLLGNAVKYTQSGGKISLTARIISRSQGCAQAEFIVKDDGMGMDAAFMERMYEPLSRSRQAIESGIEGFGLGLASVKRLAQRMNGTIHAQSEPGKGTAFTLRIPLRLQQETGAALAGKRILLAEDNDLSAEIAGAILESRGAGVRRAENGRQAVEIFMAEPVGTFDAVLLDMRMPQMGGCAAAEAIRRMARADAKCIPILALTAGGDKQDEREAIAAGMNGCLKKPLDVEALQLAMGEGERWGR